MRQQHRSSGVTRPLFVHHDGLNVFLVLPQRRHPTESNNLYIHASVLLSHAGMESQVIEFSEPWGRATRNLMQFSITKGNHMLHSDVTVEDIKFRLLPTYTSTGVATVDTTLEHGSLPTTVTVTGDEELRPEEFDQALANKHGIVFSHIGRSLTFDVPTGIGHTDHQLAVLGAKIAGVFLLKPPVITAGSSSS